MNDIIDALMEDIERGAFPYFFVKSEYRRSQQEALKHADWLENHLDEEQKAHWEKMRDADLRLDTLERKAMVRVAIAIGIRLML